MPLLRMRASPAGDGEGDGNDDHGNERGNSEEDGEQDAAAFPRSSSSSPLSSLHNLESMLRSSVPDSLESALVDAMHALNEMRERTPAHEPLRALIDVHINELEPTRAHVFDRQALYAYATGVLAMLLKHVGSCNGRAIRLVFSTRELAFGAHAAMHAFLRQRARDDQRALVDAIMREQVRIDTLESARVEAGDAAVLLLAPCGVSDMAEAAGADGGGGEDLTMESDRMRAIRAVQRILREADAASSAAALPPCDVVIVNPRLTAGATPSAPLDALVGCELETAYLILPMTMRHRREADADAEAEAAAREGTERRGRRDGVRIAMMRCYPGKFRMLVEDPNASVNTRSEQWFDGVRYFPFRDFDAYPSQQELMHACVEVLETISSA